MSGRGRRVDVRIAHTVAYLLRCPRSSVPEAMRACKFTLDESENRSTQVTIRRSLADLVELGFATRDADGKIEQLYSILNFDETCLSVDGSKGRRGGRPNVTLHDPRLPYTGKRTNKDSLTATLVMGSNAAGKALPPHFRC